MTIRPRARRPQTWLHSSAVGFRRPAVERVEHVQGNEEEKPLQTSRLKPASTERLPVPQTILLARLGYYGNPTFENISRLVVARENRTFPNRTIAVLNVTDYSFSATSSPRSPELCACRR